MADINSDTNTISSPRLRVRKVEKKAEWHEGVSEDDINSTIEGVEEDGGVVTDIRFVVTGEWSQYVAAWVIYDDCDYGVT